MLTHTLGPASPPPPTLGLLPVMPTLPAFVAKWRHPFFKTLLKCHLLCGNFPEPSHAHLQQVQVFPPLRSHPWEALGVCLLHCNLCWSVDLHSACLIIWGGSTTWWLRLSHCLSRLSFLINALVVQSLSRVWLCDPMDCSMPGFPVPLCLPEFAQIHVLLNRWCHPTSHPLSPTSPPLCSLSQHQGLFQWVSSLHQVAKVLELQLQHQAFQWMLRTDLF